MQCTSNSVGKPQHGSIVQSRVPWVNFFKKSLSLNLRKPQVRMLSLCPSFAALSPNPSAPGGSVGPQPLFCFGELTQRPDTHPAVWRRWYLGPWWPLGTHRKRVLCAHWLCSRSGTGPVKASESRSFPINAANVWHFFKKSKKSYPNWKQ